MFCEVVFDLLYCCLNFSIHPPQFHMVIGSLAEGLYSLKFHYCKNRMSPEKLSYSFSVSCVCLHWCYIAQMCWHVKLSVSSTGGSDREESRQLPVCSRNSSVSPVHLYGWSLLRCCLGLGVHTHEAQVHMHNEAYVYRIV